MKNPYLERIGVMSKDSWYGDLNYSFLNYEYIITQPIDNFNRIYVR